MAHSIDAGRVDGSHVEPIRLGGRTGRKRALSLDAKPIPEAKFASPVPERVDVDKLRRELGLSPDEDLYFVANRIDMIPRRRLAAHLGWDQAQADRVRFRVQRRIERFRLRTRSHYSDFVIRGCSLHLAFKVEIKGRRNYWCFAEITESFRSIMADERAGVFELTSAAANLKERNTRRKPKAIAA